MKNSEIKKKILEESDYRKNQMLYWLVSKKDSKHRKAIADEYKTESIQCLNILVDLKLLTMEEYEAHTIIIFNEYWKEL